MKTQTMKALTFKRYGKSPGIGFADVPRPTLKADELLVQVHAASVNPVDNMIPTGNLQADPAFPASGHAGQRSGRCGRRGRQPRDPLQARRCRLRQHLRPGYRRYRRVRGGAGERRRAEAGQSGLRAGGIDPDGRAHLLASAEGAHNLRAGQKVFIPAGSGGIGTFAIQLAKHLGAKVGTTTSTGNVELVRSLGADEVVDYKKQEFEKVLRGYDAVLGTVKGDVIEKSLGILKPGGTIVSLVGPLDAAFARARRLNFVLTFVFGLMSRKIMRLAKKRDVTYSFLFARPDGAQLAEIGKLLETEHIRPVIDKVFPFEQAKDALEYLAQGRSKGKVVIKM